MLCKKLFLILLSVLSFSSVAQATYLPNFGSYFSMGNSFYTSQDFSKLILLTCTTGVNSNCTFGKSGVASGYQVTASKTLKCWGETFINPTAQTQAPIECSSDDVGQDSAVAPTAVGPYTSLYMTAVTGSGPFAISCPAGLYVSMKSTASTAINIVCQEF